MSAHVVYLDVDDEITSAVARIRQAPDGDVVVVVPYGSRLASSRINFRLLAREAAALRRPLVIVAPEAGTRALAASAGLPTHATVLEWEQASAVRPSDGEPAPPAAADGPLAPPPVVPPQAGPGLPGRARGSGPQRGEGWAQLSLDGEGGGPGTARVPSASTAVPRPAAGGAGGPAAAMPRAPQPAPPIPVVGTPPRRRFSRGRAIAAALLVLLLLAGGGLAATMVLPTAEITVIPASEAVGPISLTVTGDPAAAAPDAAKAVVPAVKASWSLSVAATFQATGKLVTDVKASGAVTFTSIDTGGTRTFPAGTVVRTAEGVEFATNAAVTVARAKVTGLTITPATANVGVTAIKPGPEGNVAAGTIKVIANNPDPTIYSVTNAAPMTGGLRTESPQVQKSDVDAALASLRTRLNDAYAAKLADPGAIPAGTVLVQQTQRLGGAAPSVDPASLVGQQVASFDLGVAATATAIAVNPGPVTGIAESRLATSVGPGYEMVAGSAKVTVDPPVANGETVTFAVRARAERIRDIDADALRAQVLGKSIAAARSILEPFGEVRIRVWPDWVTSVPGSDGRVKLTVVPAVTASPGPAASPRPSGSAAPAPSGSRR